MKNSLIKNIVRNWGDDSIGNVLVIQVIGPELNSQHSCKLTDLMEHTYNPSAREAEVNSSAVPVAKPATPNQ